MPRWQLARRYALPDKFVESDMVLSGVEAQPTVAEGGIFANAADGLYSFGAGE